MVKAIFLILFHDLHSSKYLFLWIKSLFPRKSPLHDQVPWVGFEARNWLKEYLKKDMVVFEYGSGGSTVFISKRVSKLKSIEHNRNWYREVSKVLSNQRISNCDYVLIQPEKNPAKIITQKFEETGFSKNKELNFEKYVKSIENHPDASFDLVFIDGEARVSCISNAIKKIRFGGYLLLDNSDRLEYSGALTLLNKYKRRDFFGIVPYSFVLSQTSIWRIDSHE